MIILGKGTVITRDTDRPIIYDGAVVIDGTQIIDMMNCANNIKMQKSLMLMAV